MLSGQDEPQQQYEYMKDLSGVGEALPVEHPIRQPVNEEWHVNEE